MPDVIEVDDYICVTIYVPNDEEGRYLEAMGGALSQMGKWSYWARDDEKRGARVAEIWREHIDLTMQEAWLSGVFMTCTQIELLIDAMNANALLLANAIRALEITTTPIDCIPCEDRVETPPVVSPDPDPENPPVGENEEEWNEYLCRAANYLWYRHVMRGGAESVLLATTGGGIMATGAVLAILYASGIGAPIAFIGTIIAAIIAVAVIYDETTLEDELERLAQAVICAIYSSTGAESALQAMRDAMVSEGADQEIIDYVMAVTGSNALNKLFDGEIVVPDEFIAPTNCLGCSEVLPELPAGWRWEQNIISSIDIISSGGTTEVNATFSGHHMRVTAGAGLAYNSSGWNIGIDYDAAQGVDQYMGMLMDFNSLLSVGANSGGWLEAEFLLKGGVSDTGNITPLDEDIAFDSFYAKNVNSGTHEHDVMSAIIADVGGYFAGNAGGTFRYTFNLAYFHPWVTIENDVTIKTWSLIWDGTEP